MEEPGRLQSMGLWRVGHDWATSLSLFTFHFHTLEKEMATHSSVLALKIPGTGEPGGLQSMGSHRVRHDWSDSSSNGQVTRNCCCLLSLLEKEMATHSSILAWRMPWREEPGRLQSMGLQRVGHDWATSLSLSLYCLSNSCLTNPSFTYTLTHICACPLLRLVIILILRPE